MRWLWWIALAGCNGSDTGLSELVPEIVVAPPALDYGDQPVFEPALQAVYVTNSGRVSLDVDLSFVGGEGAWSSEVTSHSVPAGETWELPVQFLPDTFLTYEGTLELASNDPEIPLVEVQLTGQGVAAPTPDIAVVPPVLDFGDVGAGESATAWVSLRNEGDAPLELGSIEQTGSGRFVLASDPSYGTVAPDSEIPILVTFLPEDEAGDSGSLTIPSDDPDEALVEVLLLGNGGGDFSYPEAVIDCPGEAAPPEWVVLDGSGSSDPDGLDLTWRWTLTREPDGSQTDLTTFVGDETSFFADVAGIYEVQLVVTNSLGVPSAPAKCEIEAVPQDELHVELTWDTAHADLDLHVMQEGFDLFELPGDCNYCNPNPSWGPGGPTDDPRLDLDDRGGLGPENINIAVPQDGRYFVKVHYYDEHGDDATEATVRIYTYGVLAQELTKVLRRNEVWDVAQLNWPAGTVGVQSHPLYEASDRTCF